MNDHYTSLDMVMGHWNDLCDDNFYIVNFYVAGGSKCKEHVMLFFGVLNCVEIYVIDNNEI